MKDQQINQTEIDEAELDLYSGGSWRTAGKIFVGLDVLAGFLDIISEHDIDPLVYIATAAVGIGSYYIGDSKRAHQVQLYMASQLEKIAKNCQKD